MIRKTLPLLGFVLLAGCGGSPDKFSTVQLNPFGPPTTIQHQPLRMDVAEATRESAARVTRLGQKLIASQEAEKRGLVPIFHCMGTPQLAVFHRSPREIFITEGLVKKCSSDGELAAILALQMGKLISEREAMASPDARAGADQLPPIDVPIGPDGGGAFGPPDGTRMMELAQYEKQRRKRRAQASLTPPDPVQIAEAFLKKAGYSQGELKAAEPLLKEANRNVNLERQMKGKWK